MGRIADEAKHSDTRAPWTNKVDAVLAELDDEDRRVVLGWLTSGLGSRVVSADLGDYGIEVSAASIDRWRDVQRRGRGVAWAA
jgi:hypothetical protein